MFLNDGTPLLTAQDRLWLKVKTLQMWACLQYQADNVRIKHRGHFKNNKEVTSFLHKLQDIVCTDREPCEVILCQLVQNSCGRKHCCEGQIRCICHSQCFQMVHIHEVTNIAGQRSLDDNFSHIDQTCQGEKFLDKKLEMCSKCWLIDDQPFRQVTFTHKKHEACSVHVIIRQVHTSPHTLKVNNFSAMLVDCSKPEL